MRVWTDGAYSWKSQCGGWAWASNLAEYGSGAVRDTTNNRMEMQAVIEALLFYYKLPEPITIISDSMYIVGCMNNGWHHKWARNRWMKGPGGLSSKPVPNKDLWLRILNGVRLHEPGVTFEHVKGHSGDRMNDFVDLLAVDERKALEG